MAHWDSSSWTITLHGQQIKYKLSDLPIEDPHSKTDCVKQDGTLDLTLFTSINIKGVTKIINHAPSTTCKDYTYAIRFLKHKTTSPIKLMKFWEYNERFTGHSLLRLPGSPPCISQR